MRDSRPVWVRLTRPSLPLTEWIFFDLGCFSFSSCFLSRWLLWPFRRPDLTLTVSPHHPLVLSLLCVSVLLQIQCWALFCSSSGCEYCGVNSISRPFKTSLKSSLDTMTHLLLFLVSSSLILPTDNFSVCIASLFLPSPRFLSFSI